ncbi:MAG: hypothetical protein ACXVPQ_07775 [Bacteroidia bacterium]
MLIKLVYRSFHIGHKIWLLLKTCQPVQTNVFYKESCLVEDEARGIEPLSELFLRRVSKQKSEWRKPGLDRRSYSAGVKARPAKKSMALRY